tara:strand:+ start:254 stop:481 length:228 start_codon:yes stop_codon:yes gene_type:complete
MKLLLNIINNIKNLFPYFLLIAIYFLFVNIEAQNNRKGLMDNLTDKATQRTGKDLNSKVNNKDLRISIPVVPYKQ